MALTSGEKQKKATVSSIQSRMGVVDTYSGENPIGLAAKNATAVLDVFAEREAKKEEIKYKTDFKIAARKFVLDTSREFWQDPDGFTRAIDTYTNTTVEEAPNRFKDYTKEFISNIALPEGDKIWNEAKNQSDLDILQSFSDDYFDFVAHRKNAIMGLSPDGMQDYFTQDLLVELADKASEYFDLYENADANKQAILAADENFGTPDQFAHKLMIQFEGFRLESELMYELAIAKEADDKFDNETPKNLIPVNYVTNVEKVYKKHEERKKKYINDPEYDTTAGAAILKDSNRIEREGIFAYVDDKLSIFKKAHQVKLDQKKVLLASNRDFVFKDMIDTINLQGPVDEAQLTAWGADPILNLSQDQIDTLSYTNLVARTVDNLVREQTNNYVDELGITFKDGKNQYMVGQEISNAVYEMNRLLPKDMHLDKNELTQKIVEHKIFEVISSTYIPTDGETYTKDEFYNITTDNITEQGWLKNDVTMQNIVNISQMYGVVPNVLENLFESVHSLDPTVNADQIQLTVIAGMAADLHVSKTGNAPIPFANSETSTIYQNLVELNNKLKGSKNINFLMEPPESQDSDAKDARLAYEKYRGYIIEEWVSRVMPDKTILDEKIAHMNIVIDENNTGQMEPILNVMYEELKNFEEDTPNWMMGLTDKDVYKDNYEINFIGDDADLVKSFNHAKQNLWEVLAPMIASDFNNETYIGAMTQKSIKDSIKKHLPDALNIMVKAGFGPADGKGR